MSGTGAASFHNLVLRDGVIGAQSGYFTIDGRVCGLLKQFLSVKSPKIMKSGWTD